MNDYFERLLGLPENGFTQSDPSSLHPVSPPRTVSTDDDDLAWGEAVEEIGTEHQIRGPAADTASQFTGAPSPAAPPLSRPAVVVPPEPSPNMASPGSTLATGSLQEISASGLVRAVPGARESTESEPDESKPRMAPVTEGTAPAVTSPEAVIQQVLQWVAAAPSLPPIAGTKAKPADAGVPTPAPAAETPHTFPDVEPPSPPTAALPLPAIAWDPETPAAASAPTPPRLAIHIGAVHVTVETPRPAPGASPPPAPAPPPPRPILRSGSRLSRHYVNSTF